jgi:N-acetyl sugar amidotransferase
MVMRCKKCLFPDTKPDLEFKDGICSACHYHFEVKPKIDWEKRYAILCELCIQNVNFDGSWDCIIPVSGGKDSHFITYYMKEKMGMNPLLVSFIPSDQTPLGRKNLENLKKTFDVDCIEFYAKPSEYHDMQVQGLKELGDHALPEHLGIFSVPMMFADKLGIKLIVWGENTANEYGGTKKKDDQFTEGLFKDEYKPPNNPVYDYAKPKDILSIYLGDYVKWNAKEQVELLKEYGFTTNNGPMEWTFQDYENLDTKYVAIHDYFKWLKYGYGRATDQASIEIHQGRMTREEGMKMVEKYDGKLPTKYLDEFLKEFNLTRVEFEHLCEKFSITNK